MPYTGFGLWVSCPEGVEIAWGARAILSAGNIDIPYDRTTWNGTLVESRRARKALADLINLAFPTIRETVHELCLMGKMRQDEEREFVLVDEDKLKVVANTNGSYGYLYLVAFKPVEKS